MGREGYINPTAGSGNGRVVLNSSTISIDPPPSSPAVLITDSSEHQYQAFARLAEHDRRLLAGSLVVAFNVEARTVDVFYVSNEGEQSADVMSFPVN